VQLSLAGVANGQPVEADVTVSSLVDLMQGAGVGVDLRLSQGDNVVSFDGALGSDGALNGALGLSLPQGGRFLAMAGQSGDLLPAEILPIDLSAQLSVTPTAVGLSTAQIRLGRNRVAGDLTLALSEVPKLTGLLSADALDVSFLSNAQSQGGAGAASGGGWSTDPIDASGLSALDANITVVANQIDFGETLTQNARLQVTIDRARMVAQLLQAEAFGGALTGRFVANNRNGLSVGGQMQGRTVAVNALLTDLAGFERLGGVGDAELEFLGVGGSLDAIMKSLSGAGRITVNDGALRGFDLEAMMRGDTTISDAATTIFQNMSASFTIDGGVLSNQDLAVAARVLSATGAGRIDLGRQTLDYVLTPRLTGIEETGAISLPVKISGPWASPSILPDLEALARQQLEIDAARLEEEARARLAAEQAEAAERLAQEEERLRQRLQQEQDRLEDRARGALRGLLGGN
jgi:AsmA protein